MQSLIKENEIHTSIYHLHPDVRLLLRMWDQLDDSITDGDWRIEDHMQQYGKQ